MNASYASLIPIKTTTQKTHKTKPVILRSSNLAKLLEEILILIFTETRRDLQALAKRST